MMPDNESQDSNGREPPVPIALARDIKARVHGRLLQTLNLAEARRMPLEALQHECSRRLDALLDEQRCSLSHPEKQQLLREVLDEIFGLGPLEEFLRDRTISDILVNGAHQVYIERAGRLIRTDVHFKSDEHVLQVIQRIATRVGRRIDESSPMLDARLIDGSRVNAIIPPLSLRGPTLSLRRFGTIALEVDQLIQLGSLTAEIAAFLEAAVRSRLNILISGGTGSGKTTLLNILSRWIAPDTRIVTIEDAAELQLQQEHVVVLETRPPNIEGKGEVTQRDLLRNSLRMRPDRIIIGEVRGAETLDMLQAMNTGHEGSMTTVHANNPRDALGRLENMVSMAGLNYPVRAIRHQMAAALEIIVHLARLTGGRRRIVGISEITGVEGDIVCLQELFRFHQTDVDTQGHAVGAFEACGILPLCLARMRAEGLNIPADLFHRRTLASPV
jgi:pilus assembly protein CpaF